MEPKKNPDKDVHRYSRHYFLLGLCISTGLAIMAFEWTSESKIILHDPLPPETDGIEIYPVPVTVIEHTPKPENVKPIKIFDISRVEPVNEKSQTNEATITEPQPTTPGEIQIELPPDPALDTATYVFAEKMPQPLGGYAAFYKLLADHIQYPKLAKRRNTQGKVTIEFVVDRNGKPVNLKVLNGIGDGCDDEAIRVLKLTAWEPGKQRGKPVLVKMVIPVYFRLN